MEQIETHAQRKLSPTRQSEQNETPVCRLDCSGRDFTEVILDAIADGVFTVDREHRITSFNKAAEEITGVPREYALGSLCRTVFRANICENGCALKQTLCSGESVLNKTIYIVRPDGTSVPVSVSTAVLRDETGRIIGGVETFRDLSAIAKMHQELVSGSSFHEIVSRSHIMRRIFSVLPDIARSECSVLVQGPSGTGKELVARAIHDLSPRRDGPLVVINCGALPDTLLESELFGYKAGAFTDARRDKPGKFALADHGTLFLDEIGDVSPALQSRLLRVLQDKIFDPLGDTRSRATDVRIVAATNKNLPELIRTGNFREDLYYRLNVVEISLPDLAARLEDVPLLANHFLQQLCKLHQKEIIGFADEALATLLRYRFPGNVRELKNIVEHAFVLCPSGPIMPEHFPDRVIEAKDAPSQPSCIPEIKEGKGPRLNDMEERMIVEALRRNGFRRLKTARELGISKSTLWRKIKHYGIQAPARGRERPHGSQ